MSGSLRILLRGFQSESCAELGQMKQINDSSANKDTDCTSAVWVRTLVPARSYLFGALASFVYKNRFRNTQLSG